MIAIEPEGAHLERLHVSVQERLPMWVVTSNPKDYPGKVVARLFVTLPTAEPTTVAVVGDTLEEVRCSLPRGLHCLPRHPRDEAQIVETWL